MYMKTTLNIDNEISDKASRLTVYISWLRQDCRKYHYGLLTRN